MMATYFIYAFICSGMFIQGLDALQFLSEARIYPQRSDVTVDAATDLTLGCRGIEPMRWAFHDDFNGPHFNTFQKNIIHMYNEKELEYKYETILTVFNVSHVNVGFYYCHGAEVDFDTPRRSSRIYVFVHDDNHLSVITSEKYTLVYTPWVASIPCRPTAQDINITVACYEVGANDPITMSVNPGNYTAIHQNEAFVGTFSSIEGFTLDSRGYFFFADFSCVFTRNEEKSTLRLSPKRHGYIDEGISIEGPATADVGGDITLKCAYMRHHTFPYDKHWPYWEMPTSGNQLTEILRIIKLKTEVLVINMIRKNNISIEDEGNYKCQMGSGRNASKYIYVNDKKSNDSATWIYSPNRSEVQVNSGANLTLRCSGARPVTWTRHHHQGSNSILGNTSYNITHVSNLDGLYETHLHLTDASYGDVGLYHCHENGSVIDHPFQTDKIYIFVKDEQHLYVPRHTPNDVPYYSYTNETVPCLPTSRDVNVSLSMLYQAFEYPRMLGPAQKISPVIYAYDPREGFAIQLPGPSIANATCTFVTETARNTLDIQYFIFYNDEDYRIKWEPWITGPHEDLVFVGQTLELSCSVFVFYNVSDDALRWTPPNNVTLTEIIVKIEKINLHDGKMLISKLTLRDVSVRNEGRYFCHLASNNSTASKVISVYGNVKDTKERGRDITNFIT